MISIEKNKEGLTFIGYVCDAFNCDVSDIKIDQNFCSSRQGMIEVKGEDFDFSSEKNSYLFVKSK